MRPCPQASDDLILGEAGVTWPLISHQIHHKLVVDSFGPDDTKRVVQDNLVSCSLLTVDLPRLDLLAPAEPGEGHKLLGLVQPGGDDSHSNISGLTDKRPTGRNR